MDLSELIQPGLVREDTYIVEEHQSAIHVGSGSLRVLATPWMIAFMEKTARLLLGERLPAGYSAGKSAASHHREWRRATSQARSTISQRQDTFSKNRLSGNLNL